jgi:hypothetical protein
MINWLFYIYIGIGVVSLFLLMLLFILGGFDFDFSGGGPDVDIDIDTDTGIDFGADSGMGPLSLPMILSFLALLGGIGSIMTYFDFPAIGTPFVAGAGSLVLAGIIFVVMNYFLKTFSADSTVKFQDLVGKKGTVSVPINPGQEGQIILFTEQRGRTLVPAVSEKQIPNNVSIIITGVQGDTVRVMTVSDWKKKNASKKNKK